jgi:hypothetical protein
MQDFIPGDRSKSDLLAAYVEIPMILSLLVVQMPVDIHEEPAELRGMHGDVRQDRTLEFYRTLDTGEVLRPVQVI